MADRFPDPVSIDLRVRYAETDQMGVVYHANYLAWCEVGRTEFIRVRCGFPYAEVERMGVGLAVSEAALRFLAPARYDDAVRVTTELTQVRSRTVSFAYTITSVGTGATLVTATTSLVGIDREGRVTRLPERLLTALQQDSA